MTKKIDVTDPAVIRQMTENPFFLADVVSSTMMRCPRSLRPRCGEVLGILATYARVHNKPTEGLIFAQWSPAVPGCVYIKKTHPGYIDALRVDRSEGRRILASTAEWSGSYYYGHLVGEVTNDMPLQSLGMVIEHLAEALFDVPIALTIDLSTFEVKTYDPENGYREFKGNRLGPIR